jgi:thiol-disulfide isomerase/thioredoxin
MKLSKKDQSFLLLIIALVVIFYSIYSLFSSLLFSATFYRSDAGKVTVSHDVSQYGQGWFNTSRPLTASDLKDRVVLLSFWSDDCVDCSFVLSEIERLERKFGSKLTVIGVHSKKSGDKEVSQKIRKSILKNNVMYPVVNDGDLAIRDSFNITNMPSLVLLNVRGDVEKTYRTKKEIVNISADVSKIISTFKYQITHDPLPLFFEKNSAIQNVLRFPSKLKYARIFAYDGRKIPAIFITNTGNNNIVVTNLLGEIIVTVGSEIGGFKDGTFSDAAFNSPNGILYDGKSKLYVSDTGNNALRVIDFAHKTVSTLIGSGEVGSEVRDSILAKDLNLFSPRDIEFFPDKEHIVIANAGTKQLLQYDINNREISALKEEGLDSENISDLARYLDHLYVLDTQLASLKSIDVAGKVETLIDGKSSGSLSKPLGLAVDDTGIYIADKAAGSIKKYDFSSKKVSNFVGNGGQKSFPFALDEPDGIVPVLNRFYIADSGNNRILSVDRGSQESSLLDVIPALKLSKEGFLQYLPNLQKFDEILVASGQEVAVKINIKKGWKINKNGPSFINLLELKNDSEANLLGHFDWNAVFDDNIRLNQLKAGKEYTLQGVLYYCEDKENALCYVKSYEQKVKAMKGEENKEIIVTLDY